MYVVEVSYSMHHIYVWNKQMSSIETGSTLHAIGAGFDWETSYKMYILAFCAQIRSKILNNVIL